MSYIHRLMMILIMILLATVTVGGAFASTVTVSGGDIPNVGDTVSIPVTLDIADNGLLYYQMRIIVGNPDVAQITKVDFPDWASMKYVETTLPAPNVFVTAGQIIAPFKIQPGTTNVPIANITLQGLKSGSTPVTIQYVGQDLNGQWVYPTLQAGIVLVNGESPSPTTTVTTTATATSPSPTTTVTTTATATSPSPTTTVTTTATATSPSPTTTVTTTATATSPSPTTTVTTTATATSPSPTTTVPTTAPYTGPTGQAYLSTTPQGAHIVLDGTPSGAVTPIIMTVPVGSHEVILKLAGYDELQANFEVKTNAMTTVSRRLSPGSSVIPTTPVTTVVTTVPTTTVTQVTTVPTIEPTTFPTSQGSGALQIPSWATRFLSDFQVPLGIINLFLKIHTFFTPKAFKKRNLPFYCPVPLFQLKKSVFACSLLRRMFSLSGTDTLAK